MTEERKDMLYHVVVDHEIHGVTPDMLDWWFCNMEKGFVLWHPMDHIAFEWEIPPSKNGYIGAIHIAEQGASRSSIFKARVRYADPSEIIDFPIIYEHITVAVGPGPDGKPSPNYSTHQYEAASYGTRLRSIQHHEQGRPREAAEAWIMHCKQEMGYLPNFLPQLYKMWQVVEDPAINVPCCLKYPYKDINKKRVS